MNKTKILFIIRSFSLGGGAEKMLSLLTRNLDEEKYEIDILEVEQHDYREKIGPHTRVLSPILSPTKNSKWFHYIKWQLFKFFPRLMRRIKTHGKQYDYEIAYNYLYPVFCLEKNRKSISWNHGSVYNLEHEDKHRKSLGKQLQYVNRILAISQKTFDSLNYIYPQYQDKLEMLHNGYDFQEIIEMSQDLPEYPFEEDSLLFLGRIERAKGIPRLLTIFKHIHQAHPTKKLYLLGTGELDQYVQDFILENQLEETLIPLGYIKNPYPYIKKASFIVMCSEAEGFPTVFVEGLALGTGFVSTNVGGVLELAQQGKCGFVSDHDEEISQYLIEQIGRKKEDRIIKRQACIEHVSKYDIKKQVLQLEHILSQL